MRKACGFTVRSRGKTPGLPGQLYTAVVHLLALGGGKAAGFSQRYTHRIPWLNHSCVQLFTAVTNSLFPTIHTTNKNYKNFYSNNLLFINRSLV